MILLKQGSANCLVLLLCSYVQIARSDFGDFVDTSFSCPVTTTCPAICVAQLNKCPTSCKAGEALCQDGSCASTEQDCQMNPNPNPCPPCAPHACAKTIELYDSCLDKYGAIYREEEECRLIAKEERVPFNDGPPIVVGVWLILLTLAVWIWCRRNRNRMFPVVLEAGEAQTGYCTSFVGQSLYYSVIGTLASFQILLLTFVIASYRENERDALVAFEVTWSIGFVWTLAFKWPHSIRSLFLEPCDLARADQVRVFTTTESSNETVGGKRGAQCLSQLNRLSGRLSACFTAFMSFIFSLPQEGEGAVEFCAVKADQTTGGRYFVFQFRRFTWNAKENCFVPGRLDQRFERVGDISPNGLTSTEVETRRAIVGRNVVDMPHPTAKDTLQHEFSKPFYTYQLFILFTWVPLHYFYLAAIHGSVILVGALSLAWFRYRNNMNLYTLTRVVGEVEVKRDSQVHHIQQADLVPGDVIHLTVGPVFTDLVVSTSDGLLVDESALTGEANPVAKRAVDPNAEPTTNLEKNTKIMAGTSIIEAEKNCWAVVTATGSFTSKGELLRDVIHYKRHKFQFDEEVGFVIAILFMVSIVLFSIVVCIINEQPVYAWFYGMYVVGTLLPPLLPTVFTCSVGVSDHRLTKKRIACSNSEDILVSGKVDMVCFDKTGTLTKQGLDFMSVRCAQNWQDRDGKVAETVATGMACCHGLSVTRTGNAIDRAMFDASGAKLEGNKVTTKLGASYEIVKEFDFCHERMIQSVVVKASGQQEFLAIAKGSGESIRSVCREDSVPPDFHQSLRASEKEGVYQISMASAILSVANPSSLSREDVERNLIFAGVLNFRNTIRPETSAVVAELTSGAIRSIIVTGDATLTGITIGQESGIIVSHQKVIMSESSDENGSPKWVSVPGNEAVHQLSLSNLKSGRFSLAVTGNVWEAMDDATKQDVAPYLAIAGRCTPTQKVSVVSHYCSQGHVTAFVGDGSNDCGALKASHVGIALSDAEASMVSPFTSLDKNISAVPEIIKEGRCALASALSSYKYLILYGHAEAFVNVINAYFLINLSEYCWMFMDGLWLITLSFSLSLSKASESLSQSRPTASLFGPITLASTIGLLLSNTLFTILALAILFQQEWFQCRQWENNDVSNLTQIGDNYESTTIFLVTGFQYIASAVALSFGYEFRKAWYKNTWLLAFFTIFTALHFWITLVPGRVSCFWRVNCENDNVLFSVAVGDFLPIQNPFHTTVMPVSFRWTLVGIMIANLAWIVFWEYVVVNGTRRKMGARLRDEEKQESLSTIKGTEDEAELI